LEYQLRVGRIVLYFYSLRKITNQCHWPYSPFIYQNSLLPLLFLKSVSILSVYYFINICWPPRYEVTTNKDPRHSRHEKWMFWVHVCILLTACNIAFL
jgi:hypothetical protein